MNLKLHVITATVFVLLGMIVLFVSGGIHFGEPPPAPNAPVVEQIPTEFLMIDSASWGVNCAKFADRMPRKPKEEPGIALRRDNVLRPFSTLCNGQVGCEVPMTQEVLGKDPVPGCTKDMRIEYRCNDLDRVRRMQFFPDGQSVKIDCRNPETVDPEEHNHEHDHHDEMPNPAMTIP